MRTSKKIQDYLLYYMIIYMLNKSLWDHFLGSISKGLYYAILFACALGGIIKLAKKKESRRVVYCFLLYVFVIVLNGRFIANDEQRPVGYMEYLVYPLAFFAISFCMDRKKSYKNILTLFVYWGTLTALMALVEYARKAPLISSLENYEYHYYNGRTIITAYRPFVFIGSPMVLAILLGMAVVLCVYLSEFEKRKRMKYLVPIILLGIFATGSRAPLLSTVIGIVAMYYYKERLGRGNKKFMTWCLIGIFGLLFLFLLTTFFPNFKTGISFVDTMYSRFATTLDFKQEWGNVERLARWSYYLGKFVKNPIFGYGIASTSAAVASNAYATVHGVTTESGIIGRLVETGIIGCIPYYCMFFSAISLSYKRLKGYAKERRESTFFALIGTVVLFLVEDAVLQVSLDIFATFAVWLFIAFCYNTVRHIYIVNGLINKDS